MSNKSSDTKTIKSDDTLFSILDLLEESGPMKTTEIANELGRAKSTVHYHLRALENKSFVTKTNGRYKLGMRFLELGITVQNRHEIYPMISEHLDELAEETGEQVWCTVVENGYGFFLDGSGGEYSVPTDANIGKRMNLHYMGSGKAILAYMDREEVEEIIAKHGLESKTQYTITNPNDLLHELDEIRESGYAVNLQEALQGVHHVGAPILDDNDDPIAGIEVVGAAHRLTEERCHQEISGAVKAKANEIELSIQFS